MQYNADGWLQPWHKNAEDNTVTAPLNPTTALEMVSRQIQASRHPSYTVVIHRRKSASLVHNVLRIHGSITPLHSDSLWDISFSTVSKFPMISKSLPPFYSQGVQPHLLTRNEMWLKYCGNIPCDIQINDTHTAVQFYTQVQKKQLHSIVLSSTNIWNIQLFAANELMDSTNSTVPTSVCERSQQNIIKSNL